MSTQPVEVAPQVQDSGTTFDAEAARAAGVVTEQTVITDFFGFIDEERWYFPDDAQYMLLQRMSEGKRANYQRAIRSDLVITRGTGDARMTPDPSKERHALIKACVVNWHVVTKDSSGNTVEPPFSLSNGKVNLEYWLSVADPRLVDDLEKACRKINPWLNNELSVEEIDKEIENLKELREEAVKREAGE